MIKKESSHVRQGMFYKQRHYMPHVKHLSVESSSNTSLILQIEGIHSWGSGHPVEADSDVKHPHE